MNTRVTHDQWAFATFIAKAFNDTELLVSYLDGAWREKDY